MSEILTIGSTAYLSVKTLHVLAIITWMAALFYLPRLFVYHADTPIRTPQSETFKVMERRLQRGIMTPSMILVFITGGLMFPSWAASGWLHAKVVLVLLMAGLHGAYSRWRRDFAEDRNAKSSKFYRWANEAPTVLLIGIVILVIVKPF